VVVSVGVGVGSGDGDVGSGVGDVGPGVGEVGAGVGNEVVGAGAGVVVVGAGCAGAGITEVPPEPEPRPARRGWVVDGAAVLVGVSADGVGTTRVASGVIGVRGKLRETSSDVRIGAAGAAPPPAVIIATPRPDPERIRAERTRKAFLRPGSSRR
jgi:hypothetical protein